MGRLSHGFARLRSSGGTRSGAELAVASALWTAASALFSLICIRFLGSERFGDVATMTALGTVVAIPLGSIQSLLAREAAEYSAAGDRAAVRSLFRRHVKAAAIWSSVATAVLIALSIPIGELTNVGSFLVVAIGLAVVPFYAVGFVLNGFLQGLQRFRSLAGQIALSGLSRPVMVLPVFLVGFGAGGALGVNVLASALAVVLGFLGLRDIARGPRSDVHPRMDRREVAILLGGTLAFASLTNLDVVLANSLLTDREGGLYAGASVVAKLILFFPVVVSTVLLPKATSRAAEGRSSAAMLRLSVLVTAGVALAAAAVLQAVPESWVVSAFGEDFRGTGALLGRFGLAMALMGVINVLLYYYLAYRRPGFPLLVGAGAIAQIVGFAVWHPDPGSLIWVSLASAATVLVLHELFFEAGLVRSIVGSRTRATAG